MRYLPLATSLLMLAALPLQAQQTTKAKTTSTKVVPGLKNAALFEKPSENQQRTAPARVSTYIPTFREETGDAEDLAVYRNPETGETEYIRSPRGPLAPYGFVSGNSEFTEAAEPLNQQRWVGLSTRSPYAFPWSSHVRVFFVNPSDSKNYVCSGTLVDAKHVFTAGHCVHEGDGGDWMNDVWVAPGWDGDADLFGTAEAVPGGLWSWSWWTALGSSKSDQGYIRLDRPVGFLTGWLGYGYNTSNSWWRSHTMHQIGWPSGCWTGAPDQLYYGYGKFDTVRKYYVRESVSWTNWIGGMSGGGNYYKDSSGNRYVMADNSKGWYIDSNGNGDPDCGESMTKFQSCRMIQGKFETLRDTIIAGVTPSSADYISLWFKTADWYANSSDRSLGKFTYRVGNYSSYNPASQTFHGEIYMSTNDTISTFDTLIQSHTFTWNFGAKSYVKVNGGTIYVPSGTSPGWYYVGVVITDSDYNSSNNDSSGQDAMRIYYGG